MEKEEIIKKFAMKCIIKKKEVQNYDQQTMEVFNELLENGCINLKLMKVISGPSFGRGVSSTEEIYEVDTNKIKKKYMEQD